MNHTLGQYMVRSMYALTWITPILVLGDLDDRPAVAHAEAEEALMIVGDEIFLLGLVGLIQLAVEAVRADGVVLRTGRERMAAYITSLEWGTDMVAPI